MAQIEPIGFTDKTRSPAKPKKVREAKEVPVRRRRRPRMHAVRSRPAVEEVQTQEEPELRLTAAEWAKRIAAEEIEKRKHEEQKKEAESPGMTKEDYIRMQKEGGEKPEPQPPPKNPLSTASIKATGAAYMPNIINLLQANADAALGAKPAAQPQPSGASAEVEAPLIQELPSSGAGLFSRLNSDPVAAGTVAFVGLLITFMGTFIRGSLMGLGIEIVGFAVFFVALIYVAKHTLKMLHR